ncbi:hypothetical protein [Helicobacter canis]|nr:hypothetical protein [Helicobacter canis]
MLCYKPKQAASHQAPIRQAPIIVGITPHHKRGSGARWVIGG